MSGTTLGHHTIDVGNIKLHMAAQAKGPL